MSRMVLERAYVVANHGRFIYYKRSESQTQSYLTTIYPHRL